MNDLDPVNYFWSLRFRIRNTARVGIGKAFTAICKFCATYFDIKLADIKDI